MGGESCQFVGGGAGAQAEGGRDAKAMGGKGAIGAVEDLAQNRGAGEEIQGIGPPDATEDVAIDIGALNLRAIGEEEAEVVEKICLREEKTVAYPGGLKRSDFETSPHEGCGPERNPAPAEAAGGVIEDVALIGWHGG